MSTIGMKPAGSYAEALEDAFLKHSAPVQQSPIEFVSKDKPLALLVRQTHYPSGIIESHDKRKASPKRLVELANSCGIATTEQQWREELARSVAVRTLWSGDLLIGFGLVRLDDDGPVLDRAFIHPDYRRRGLFRTLLLRAEYACVLRFNAPPKLYVNPDRADIYKKLGWTQVTQ